MYNLVTKPRNKGVKAKTLRHDGIIPATIYGRNLEESVHIQISPTDVKRFLSAVSKGSTLTVNVDDKKYNVMFKNITHHTISRQIEHIEFQHIVADEAVNGMAKIVLVNREKNENLVLQQLEEVHYNALPRHFVNEITIDVAKMGAGSVVKLEDLDIAKNENIKLTTVEDSVVLTVAEKRKMAVEENTDEEEQES